MKKEGLSGLIDILLGICDLPSPETYGVGGGVKHLRVTPKRENFGSSIFQGRLKVTFGKEDDFETPSNLC